jgi:hypothetical protein
MVPIPDDYAVYALIPAVLHIDPLTFLEYPPAMQYKIRVLLNYYIASGGVAHGRG